MLSQVWPALVGNFEAKFIAQVKSEINSIGILAISKDKTIYLIIDFEKEIKEKPTFVGFSWLYIRMVIAEQSC